MGSCGFVQFVLGQGTVAGSCGYGN